MERLTKTWGNNCVSTKINYAELLVLDNNTSDEIKEVIKKLGKFEQLEEQDRLIILPCRIGEQVWIINFTGLVERVTFTGVVDMGTSEVVFQYRYQFLTRNVYLTQEEAEEALEEMKK